MKSNYQHIFTPLTVKNMTIKNRIVMMPMGTNYGEQNGEMSFLHINYYKERAKGGTGLIIVENASVDSPQGSNGTTQLRIDHDNYLPRLYKFCEEIHKYGTCIAIQINHAGASAVSARTNMQPVSASDVPSKEGGEIPRPLSVEEIHHIVKKYEKWYGIEHKAPQFIDEAVYGLCEINREDIKKARLIANPGCYPTCSTLSIYPLLKEGLIDPNTIIIDAKSGTSGAGRGAKVPNLYCEVNENIKAYGVATHRHTPEIEDQLGYACGQEVLINFTPHLIPMNRGILVTAYASLKKEVSYEEVRAAYDKYYADETFIRVLDKDVCPQTKCVEGSNYVDVNFKIDLRTRRVIMMGAIDNLVKGAAGQAVQNMNLMFGFDEAEGLHQIPMLP